MKRQAQTPLLLAATLFLGTGLLAADEPKTAAPAPAPAPAMMKPARADELLKRFDTNHDGKLDEDEVAAAHEAMLKEQMDRQAKIAAAPAGAELRQKMLEQFDRNHDGRLDDDERAEMRKYGEEHGLGPDGEVRAELLKRFDQNADGKLDDTERTALEKFLEERRAQAGAMRERLLRQFDRDGNGQIDETEVPAFDQTMRARIESNPLQRARYDQDGDGKLNDAEWTAAREQLLRLVNNPPPAATQDPARLARVAEEVARRKAAREKAQKEAAPNP